MGDKTSSVDLQSDLSVKPTINGQFRYAALADRVFASPRIKDKKPYRCNNLVANHLRVAAANARIVGPVAWHTFRRSISTWLIDNDENAKVTPRVVATRLRSFGGPVNRRTHSVI